MKTFLFLNLLLCFPFFAFNQDRAKIDSLKLELGRQGIADTSRIRLFLGLSEEYRLYSKSKALHYTNLALALSKKTHSLHSEFNTYLHTALVYFYQEEIDSSLIFSNKALELAQQHHELNKWEQVAYEHIGHSYYYKGNYKEALYCFQLALKTDAVKKDIKRASVLVNKIGNCYNVLHYWGNALLAYQRSLDIYTKLNDSVGMADVYVNMGTLKDEIGEKENAKKYYLMALGIYEKENMVSEMSVCYNNLGDYYSDEGEYEKALGYFTKSLLLDRQLDDDFGISIDIFNIAENHLNIGDTAQALIEYSRSLQLAEDIDFNLIVAHSNYALGEIAQSQGKTSDAIVYGLNSLEAGKEMDSPEIILKSCKLLSTAYKTLGQYKKAFECLNEYQILYDSIFTAEKSRQLIEINTKYETGEKEKQNDILTITNAVQRKNQSILIISLIIAILFLISVFLLWLQRRKTARKLIKQKRYYEKLIENSDDFVVVVGQDGKTKYVSPSYNRKMGWGEKVRIGHSPLENVHPNDIQKIKGVQKDLFSGMDKSSCEFRLMDTNGNWHWMVSLGKNLLNDPDINAIVINFWDITERKKIEKLIEESREDLSKSQVFARIGSWQFYLETGKLILSKELVILLNAGSEEISIDIFGFIDKFIYDEDKEFLNQRIAKAAKSQDIIGYTDRFRLKVKTDNPKGYIITELWGNVVDPGLFKGVTQDITDKVEAEQKIIDSEKSYRELFDKAFDAIYILNEQGEFIDVNKGAENMYAYPKESFIGKTPAFLSAPGKNDLKEIAKKIKEAFRGNPSQFEFWGIDKEGMQFPKVVKLTPGTYFGEKVVIAIAMDITELVNIQELINQKEKEYQRIYNAFPDIYFKSVFDGAVLEISPSVYGIAGLTQEEVIGKTSRSFYFSDEEYERIGRLFLETGTVKDVDIKLKTKDNKPLDCSFSASITFDENGKPLEMEGVIRDISQRVKTLKKLVESEKKLKEANLTKDKVFSIISHDLRGPISTNKSIVDLVVNEFDKISKEEIYKLMDSYKPTADATYFLLENLLSWSRSQMGQISFNPGLNPVNSIVQENMELYSSHAKLKDIRLINKVQPDLIGYFDKTMLDIVIRNLLSNALKFTPDKGQVKIKSSIGGNFIYLSISDTGVGIPESQIKNIFGDLDSNKITSAGTNNEKGAGLGLVLCQEFVELNGGEIQVISKEGEGSTFMFSVPLYNY